MLPENPAKSVPTPKAGVDLEKVRAALTPALAAYGVELFDLEWLTERAGWTLRVFIERPGAKDAAGGVMLEDCVEASREVSAVLDADEELIPHHYNLEVSSPGLERKLRGPGDFVRFVGMLAKVKLSRPAPDGQRVLRGLLEEAPEGRVAVRVDGKRVEVPVADVAEGRLVYELQTGQKMGKPKRGTASKRSRESSHDRGRAPSERSGGASAPGERASSGAAKKEERGGSRQ